MYTAAGRCTAGDSTRQSWVSTCSAGNDTAFVKSTIVNADCCIEHFYFSTAILQNKKTRKGHLFNMSDVAQISKFRKFF